MLRDAYQNQGVVTVPGLLSAERVAEIKQELDRYIREDLGSLPVDARTYEADGETVRNLWRLEQHNPYFRGLAESQAILAVVRECLNGEPVLLGVETFNKPAKVGSGVPWHQDNAYFCLAPPDALTVWIALDAVTPENGPVNFIMGSHQWGMQPTAQSGVKGNSIGLREAPDVSDDLVVRGLLRPGDATVHHCQTLHCSVGNTTQHARLGLLLVYRGDKAAANPELKDAYDSAVSSMPPA